MEIIKEIELPAFDLKIKLFEEFNKYYNKKYQYFNIYIDNKKIFNNRTKSYKYFSIDIELTISPSILNIFSSILISLTFEHPDL